jgi:Effector Associated Constant Component 1
MSGSVSALSIAIELDSGADAEELDQQLRWLREELLELEVEAVNRVTGDTAPQGAKSPAADLTDTLIIAFSNSAVLAALVGVLRTWLSRGSGRKVKLQIGADRIEIEGLSTADQEKLIEQWIARNGG